MPIYFGRTKYDLLSLAKLEGGTTVENGVKYRMYFITKMEAVPQKDTYPIYSYVLVDIAVPSAVFDVKLYDLRKKRWQSITNKTRTLVDGVNTITLEFKLSGSTGNKRYMVIGYAENGTPIAKGGFEITVTRN